MTTHDPNHAEGAATDAPRPAPPLVNRCPYRVIYRDTDRAGHMYYGNYLALFEIGRTTYLRACGGSYRSWEERGYLLPVRSCTVDYLKPAYYDDVLTIETRLVAATAVQMSFEYRILRASADGGGEDLLCTGATRHPFLRADGRVSRDGLKLLGELGLTPALLAAAAAAAAAVSPTSAAP